MVNLLKPLEAEFGSKENVRLILSKEREEMFNEEEVKFIKETTEKDLKAVDQRVERTVNEMAVLGKNLSDLKVVQSKLQSVLQAIVDDEKDKGSINIAGYTSYNRCC